MANHLANGVKRREHYANCNNEPKDIADIGLMDAYLKSTHQDFDDMEKTDETHMQRHARSQKIIMSHIIGRQIKLERKLHIRKKREKIWKIAVLFLIVMLVASLL